MLINNEFKSAVLQLKSQNFEDLALEIFNYQASQNPTYRSYLQHLHVKVSSIKRADKIPCMPIQFFKKHAVVSGNVPTQMVFESSGTTGDVTSKHFMSDLPFYETISQKIFEDFYGPLTDFHILALLPSYLERNTSSLVYMVQSFIYRSYSQESGFYLKNTKQLLRRLKELLTNKQDTRKILLIGVTFALLDLAESEADLSFIAENAHRLVVMETGGMKGRRKELLREEVHEILTKAFGINKIHSEYGMTELTSQGYSKGDGVFELPANMRIYLREVNDPFSYLPSFSVGDGYVAERGKTGGINVIDLANIDSCCFIETQDLGNFMPNYQAFKIAGRFDNSDIRGCNLMVL